jgi:hypothetical protein
LPSDLLFDQFNRVVVRKACNVYSVADNLYYGLAVLVNEVGNIKSILMGVGLNGFVPICSSGGGEWRLPDIYTVWVCQTHTKLNVLRLLF